MGLRLGCFPEIFCSLDHLDAKLEQARRQEHELNNKIMGQRVSHTLPEAGGLESADLFSEVPSASVLAGCSTPGAPHRVAFC